MGLKYRINFVVYNMYSLFWKQMACCINIMARCIIDIIYGHYPHQMVSNYLATLIYILWVCVWGWVCHCLRLKVRGQLDRLCSYLLPCGSQSADCQVVANVCTCWPSCSTWAILSPCFLLSLAPYNILNPNILQERTDKHTGQCLLNNCFPSQRINSSFEDLRQVLGEELIPEENHGDVNMSKLTLTKSSPCTSLTQNVFCVHQLQQLS